LYVQLYNEEYEEKFRKLRIDVPNVPLHVYYCGAEEVKPIVVKALEIEYYLDGEYGDDTEVYNDTTLWNLFESNSVHCPIDSIEFTRDLEGNPLTAIAEIFVLNANGNSFEIVKEKVPALAEYTFYIQAKSRGGVVAYKKVIAKFTNEFNLEPYFRFEEGAEALDIFSVLITEDQ